jgi:hypothetical protein
VLVDCGLASAEQRASDEVAGGRGSTGAGEVDITTIAQKLPKAACNLFDQLQNLYSGGLGAGGSNPLIPTTLKS